MRIWDVSVEKLCRMHLLTEHRELHAIWSIITQNKKGYSKHPETLRWIGKLKGLYNRHEEQVFEMKKRRYNHLSPLDKKQVTDDNLQDIFIDPIEEQINLLREKKCICFQQKID
jgi:hypothetical protein